MITADVELYLILFAIVAGAKALGELSARLGLPSVLGEVVAGLILGPSVLDCVPPSAIIDFMAELGIMLFIFEVGLESDLSDLFDAGTNAIRVAIAGAFLPLAGIVLVGCRLLGLDMVTALFAGGTMAATSIGVTARMLDHVNTGPRDGGHSPTDIIMGAAVLDDILGILLLAVLTDLSAHGQFSMISLVKIGASVAVILIVVPALSAYFTLGVQYLHRDRLVPGLLPGIHVSILLLFTAFSKMLKVPEILGSYMAGLIMIQREAHIPGVRWGRWCVMDRAFLTLLKERIRPLVRLATPFFFVRIGLSMDLRALDWSSSWFWLASGMFIAVGVAGKFLSGYVTTGMSGLQKALVGVCMIPRGEVALVFVELGRTAGLMDPQLYASLVMAVVVTTFIPLFVLGPMARRLEAQQTAAEESAHASKQ